MRVSFFKRLKQKLSGKSEEQLQETLEEQTQEDVSAEEEVPAIEETKEGDQEVVKSEAGIEEPAKEEEEEPKVEEKKPSAWSITQKFKMGLAKTRDSFTSKVNDLVARYRKVDEDFFEELEEVLLQADVGFETVMELMDELRFEVQRKNIKETEAVQEIICEKLVEIYEKGEDNIAELNLQPKGELTVILFVGVNGVGKTTTIGKLANRLKNEGKTVMLAAGDTFRAGAIDQLQVWGDRVGCEVVKQSEEIGRASCRERGEEEGGDVECEG